MSTTFSIDDMKRKIAALLAKAEATSVEAEQHAFTEKAERLMIRLGIDAAELEAAGHATVEDIVQETRVWRTIYAPTMAVFAFRVGTAYGHLNFLQSRRAKDFVRTYVIGFTSDVEQFLTLLDSLHLQVFAALKQFRKDNRYDRQCNTIHENFVVDRSFIEGYADSVAYRLRSMRVTEEKTATPGAALVLVGKEERVEAWTAEQHPNARSARQVNRQQSWSGRQAGSAAGERASLGGKGIGSQRVVSS